MKIKIIVESPIGVQLFTASAESIEGAVEELYRYERHRAKEDAEEAEHERIVEGLTREQEEILKEIHSRNYTGLDDDMTDDFEDWLMETDSATLKRILGMKADAEEEQLREKGL